MPFKIQLLSDVRQFLKGTDDVAKALDDVGQSLDQLATSSEADAAKASDAIESKFKAALDEVADDSKKAGKSLGDNVHAGAKRANDGISNMRDEGKQSVRETAASFTDITDALDLVQEVSANAFVGFGPAGMAAGAAAAIGIGLLKSSLDAAKQKADDTVKMVHGIASALRESGGSAKYLADSMEDIVDEKEWFEFWQKLPVDRLSLMAQQMRELGLDSDEVFKAMSGDMEAYDRIARDAIQRTSEANLESAVTFLNGVRQQGEAMDAAKKWNEDYANSSVAAAARQEEAQKKAADAVQAWADSLTDHLSVSDEGLGEFVRQSGVKLKEWNKKLREATKEGTLDVDAWADEVKRRAKEDKLVLKFTTSIESKLSPEALAQFEKLPAETQVQIAKAYKKGDRKKIVQTLEAEAKVTKVTVDTSGVKAPKPVEIPAVVVGTGVPQDVQAAAHAGQSEADKTANKVELKFKIDRDDLQRQVNRAAASITPPTITVKTRTKSEVP